MKLEWVEGESVTFPKGFRAGAVYAGLKTPGPGKLDVGVILSDVPCSAAGTFTSNKVAAAPVVVSRERVSRGQARGIVFNAGNHREAMRMKFADFARLVMPNQAALAVH